MTVAARQKVEKVDAMVTSFSILCSSELINSQSIGRNPLPQHHPVLYLLQGGPSTKKKAGHPVRLAVSLMARYLD